MDERDRWSLAWGTLTIGAFTGFAILETLALRQPPPHPTYSRSLARWFGCHPRKPHRTVALAVFTAAELALAAHVARYHTSTRALALATSER